MAEFVYVLEWDGQYPDSGHRVEGVYASHAAAVEQIPEGYARQEGDTTWVGDECKQVTVYSKSFKGSPHTEDYIIQEWEVSA